MADSKYIPRLKLVYKNEIVPALIKDMNISNVMLVPKIEKIVINIGKKITKKCNTSNISAVNFVKAICIFIYI